MANDTFGLHELNTKSGSVGAWVVRVHKMQLITYEYTRQNQAKKGYKLECMLVAADGVYCQGVIKSLWITGKPAAV